MRSAPKRPGAAQSILLVDDNSDGIMARSAVLEELGYEVAPACCGSDALQLAAKKSFDLVITDYKMAPIDGLELIRQLRENEFKKPIILLTGFAENLGLRPDGTGADVVIQKSSNEVASLVRHTRRLLSAPRKPAASQTARKTTNARAK